MSSRKDFPSVNEFVLKNIKQEEPLNIKNRIINLVDDSIDIPSQNNTEIDEKKPSLSFKKVSLFQCHLCKKIFQFRSDLLIHKITHSQQTIKSEPQDEQVSKIKQEKELMIIHHLNDVKEENVEEIVKNKIPPVRVIKSSSRSLSKESENLTKKRILEEKIDYHVTKRNKLDGVVKLSLDQTFSLAEKIKKSMRKQTDEIEDTSERSILPCQSCGEIFETVNELLMHQDSHTPDRSDEIEHVQEKTVSVTVHPVHFNMVMMSGTKVIYNSRASKNSYETKITKLLRCIYCHSSFTTKAIYDLHLQKHRSENKFYCKLTSCKFSAIHRYEINIHMNQHINSFIEKEKSKIVKTAKVEKKIPEIPRDEMSFMLSLDDLDSDFRCSFCKKNYTNQMNLETHIKKFHSKPKLWNCDQSDRCKFKTESYNEMYLHLLSHILPYSCSFCKFIENIIR